MKVIVALALLAAAPTFSCDITAGPGKVVRYSEGETGGMATVGCIFKKWELRGYWIGEQRIYHETLKIDAYPAISASRLWIFREGRRIQPMLGVGLMLKPAQRCHFDGDANCNRQMPLPFGFLATVGVRLGDILITVGHASNDSLDYGPEKKNLGLDQVRSEVWF